ncbi:MAG: ribosome assembly cofactor RimP [Prevotellaceae bacterium]|nr:ribosome assembly cofactor RimP [Prevotellaceae bacterium]
MITKETVYQFVESRIGDEDLFLVDVQITADKRILVEIDTDNGGVSIDTCIALSRYITAEFEEEIGDYELEVASAGVGQPFKILRQYTKHIGKEVEVLTKNGVKHTGVLQEVTPDGFAIETTKKIKLPDAKRKTEVTENVRFTYNEIKQTKYIFKF